MNVQDLTIFSKNDFETVMKKTKNWAKSVGYRQSDVNGLVKSYRKNKHKRK